MQQKRRPERDDCRRDRAGVLVEKLTPQEVDATQDREIEKQIEWFSAEDVMAQQSAESGERKRVKPAVKGRFRIEPRADAVRLHCAGEIARDALVADAVNGESQTSSVFVKGIWQKLKMTGEKEDRK